MDLSSLDKKQLRKIISDANSALTRRQKVEKAMTEIRRISKKHKLSKDELHSMLVSIQSDKVSPSRKPGVLRAQVSPKYQSLDGTKNWTGRGRTPSWVDEICQSHGLTVESFKSDPRFFFQNGSPKRNVVSKA